MSKREVLLVDGYNVMHASSRYTSLFESVHARSLNKDPFERARRKLISDVATFAQNKYCAYLIFDAAQNVAPNRENCMQAGVHVVFSCEGESADTVIERMAKQACQEQKAVSVVTSDATIQSTVFAQGVTRISSRMFLDEIASISSVVEEHFEETPHKRFALEDRISAEAREKLNDLLGR